MTDFRALCAELTEFVARLTKHYYEPAELLTRARAALAEADEPAVPQGREPAAVATQPSDEELLERQVPVLVPVAVSDALIKAECALADIAEGEPMTDEGDPLQWAERRCADALAIIRPTMRQHKIRTSEWPPVDE